MAPVRIPFVVEPGSPRAFDEPFRIIDPTGPASGELKINSIAGDVRFPTGSAHNISLQDESVDAVFGIAILHHLDLALASPKCIAGCARAGGSFFMKPIRNSALIRSIRKLVPVRARMFISTNGR